MNCRAAYRRAPSRTSHSPVPTTVPFNSPAVLSDQITRSGESKRGSSIGRAARQPLNCEVSRFQTGSGPNSVGKAHSVVHRLSRHSPAKKHRSKKGLKRYANAHLKFVGHHTLAQRLTEEVLLRYHRRRCQGPITFRHKPTAESCTDIGEQCLLTDLQSATQGRRLSNRILMSVYTSRPLCPRAR